VAISYHWTGAYGLVAKHLPNAQVTGTDPQHCSDQGKIARILVEGLIVHF
jgi:hypothetical protein